MAPAPSNPHLAAPTRWCGGLAIAVTLLTAACTHRIDLTPTELTRIERFDGDLRTLRVFPDEKLISTYSEAQDDQRYDVGKRKITVRGAYRPLRRIIGRGTPGKVIQRDEQNGMPALWIAFDNACKEITCAYAFVLTEVGRYQLVSVPARDGYQPPENFRRTRLARNLLKKSTQRSLADANEVYAVKRRRGELLTVDLKIRKDAFRPTHTAVERARGVD